jgi:hypothetical protein
MSHNDITGDKIATDVASEAYRNNYDRIFGKTPSKVLVDEVALTIADMVEQEKEKDDRTIAADLSGN